MMKDSYILKLYKSPSTVFTAKNIALAWEETNLDLLKSRINYYIKTEKLIPLRRGIYAKDDNYNKFEFATKVYLPAYISFETVLQKEGLIFQFYGSVFAASYLTRKICIKNQNYIFRKMKDEILTNTLGIEKRNTYFVATKERAFLDTLYLFKDYHFDNLKALDWNAVFKISPIYENKRMLKTVDFLYKRNKNA